MAFNLTPVGLAVKAQQFATKGGFTNGLGDAWAKGQREGANKPKNGEAGGLGGVTEGMKNSLAGKPAGGEGESSAASGTGGASGKNITINIAQLGPKELIIHAAQAMEGVHEFTDKLRKSLIAVTNDAETTM